MNRINWIRLAIGVAIAVAVIALVLPILLVAFPGHTTVTHSGTP